MSKSPSREEPAESPDQQQDQPEDQQPLRNTFQTEDPHDNHIIDTAAAAAAANMPSGASSNSPSHDDSSAESTSSRESGEASPAAPDAPSSPANNDAAATANGNGIPALPNEPAPAEDDGWEYHWDATNQAYFFYNRLTHASTWENPRLATDGRAVPGEPAAQTAQQPPPQPVAPGVAEPPKNERPPAGGYNPAIHGDYDPNAWYARGDGQLGDEDGAQAQQQQQPPAVVMDSAAAHAAIGSFNRFTGRWQGGADQDASTRHSDEAKSRRQMSAFFDVDAAANAHDGRSLRAERAGKKPTKGELKHFKEKRRARKEEKRRAWLRD